MEIVWILLGILGVLLISGIIIYNRLVLLNMRTKNAWSQIDNQLKRRSDLIPNLLNVTKGYAKYESETLENVVRERNLNGRVEDIAKNSNEISNSLTRLLAVAESYPDLKANQLFLNLQIELTGTEDKIAYARQFYNDTVQQYNTSIMVFPNNIFANMLGFKEKEYFKVLEKDKELVKVEL